MNIHPEARTTPQIRAEIKAASGISQKALAEKYNVTPQTICDYILSQMVVSIRGELIDNNK